MTVEECEEAMSNGWEVRTVAKAISAMPEIGFVSKIVRMGDGLDRRRIVLEKFQGHVYFPHELELVQISHIDWSDTLELQ